MSDQLIKTKIIRANRISLGSDVTISPNKTFFNRNIQSMTATTFNMKPGLINLPNTYVKNSSPSSNIINLVSPRTLYFDKIVSTKQMSYIIGNSLNTYDDVSTVFIPSPLNSENTLIDVLSIPSSFLTTDGETITVPFTYKMKYVGILKQCNDIPNTTIEGTFVISRVSETEYTLTSWKILSIDYNSNDFCSHDLSPYYFYDECPDIDNDECIEQNIWDQLENMFENAVVQFNTVNNSSSIKVILTINTFHDKIKNIIGTYTLINTDSNSILTLIFNEKSNTFAEINSIAGKKILPIVNDKIVLTNMTKGSNIDLYFVSGNNSGIAGSTIGNFVRVIINTMNPSE